MAMKRRRFTHEFNAQVALSLLVHRLTLGVPQVLCVSAVDRYLRRPSQRTGLQGTLIKTERFRLSLDWPGPDHNRDVRTGHPGCPRIEIPPAPLACLPFARLGPPGRLSC